MHRIDDRSFIEPSTCPSRLRPGPPRSLRPATRCLALHRVLHRQHPEPEHAPRLRSAVGDFFRWCDKRRIHDMSRSTRPSSPPTSSSAARPSPSRRVKQHLAAVRMLFDWLVIGQVVPTNPAQSVRGPKHVVKRERRRSSRARRRAAPRLDRHRTRSAALRDRALIGVMVYSFARVGAVSP